MHSKMIRREKVLLSAALLFIMGIIGCNGLPSASTTAKSGPQTYMAPVVAAWTVDGSLPVISPTTPPSYVTLYYSATAVPATYTIDDAVNAYSQTTNFEENTFVNNSGTFGVLDRSLLALGTTYGHTYDETITTNATTTYSPSLPGSYAVELAGQAGGLVQLLKQAATPIVATQDCPSFATAQTFQFITLPAALISSGAVPANMTWNPATETAFGSASISTTGTAVNLSSIQQFTLPAVNGGAPGAPARSFETKATGICSPTPYGNTISVPATATVTNPGGGTGTQSVTPTAMIGIGPTGLLVEWNGNPSAAPYYDNVLGAGTGAIGLPQPSASLDTTDVTGKQYLGFIYGTGSYVSSSKPTGWSSTLASFGFPSSLQTSCASFAAQTGTLADGIYGGDFPVNATTGVPDPSTTAVQGNGGYGNCDFAIDLGTQSATSYGLYPSATVWIGSQFSANSTSPAKTYSFPAVAIAGKLNGKYAIFVIGKDATSAPNQAWSIYLMQSN